MNLCENSSLLSLINLLNYTSHAVINLIGIFVVFWLFLELFFKVDLLDSLFNNKFNCIKYKKYNFLEIFLYAFVFGLVATVFNDLLRNYDGYIIQSSINFVIYFIVLFLVMGIGVYIVYKKYNERSISDLLYALLAISIILIFLVLLDVRSSQNIIFLILFTLVISLMFCYSSLVKSEEKDFSKENIRFKVLKLLHFCRTKNTIDTLYVFIFVIGFTALFFLFDNFLSAEHIIFYLSKENGIYYIFTIITVLFFIFSQKSRVLFFNLIIPIFMGGTLSVLFIAFLKLVFLRN